MMIKNHPLAGIIPSMSEEDYRDLKEDIGKNGLEEKICLYESMILDGRHRHRACAELKITPKYEKYLGSNPLQFVLSKNLKRRHLTDSQKAAIIVDVEAILAGEAEKRRIEIGKMTGRGHKKVKAKMPEPLGQSRDQAAKLAGVSPRYVQDAKKLKKESPERFKEVREGKKTITQAKREIKEEGREKRRDSNREKVKKTVDILKSGAKFATIVIDPPWDWGDEKDANQLGRARPDYATMPFEEIKKLPVGRMADDDCHLYLWITNRSLPKGFILLESWGFRYVTMLTWCKPSIGMGNYFRGSTEHVLFGIKGSQALKRKDQGTWFSAPREKGHSSKPGKFFEIVESCSPGPYLEMFARGERKGWAVWGGEANGNG